MSLGLVKAGLFAMPLSGAVSALLLLAAFLREALARRGELGRLPRTPVGRLFGLLVLVSALSAAFSAAPGLAVAGPLVLCGYAAAFYAAAWTASSQERLAALWRAVFGVAVFFAVVGLVIYALNLNVAWAPRPGIEVRLGTPDRRVNSLMFHPNLLAGFLVLGLSAGLALVSRPGGGNPPSSPRWGRGWPRGRVRGLSGTAREQLIFRPCVKPPHPPRGTFSPTGEKRAVFWSPIRSLWCPLAGLLALLAALVLTASRGGWLAAGVCLLLFGALGDRRWLIGLLGTAVASYLAFPGLLAQRLGALSFGHPAFDHDRLDVWVSAARMLAARPLTGWGHGSWGLVYPQYRLPSETQNLPHAHNFFLHTAVEQGLPVVLILTGLVAWVVARAVRAAWRTPLRRPALAMAAGVVGYSLMCLFDHTLAEARNAAAFFLLVGGLEAVRRMAGEHPGRGIPCQNPR